MNFNELFSEKEKEVIKTISDKIISLEAEQKQRTAEWFEARRGKFSASKIKDLISCDRKTAKLPLSDPAKIIGIGEVAKKYIYKTAKERQYYRVPTATTWAMNFGTENEKVIKKILSEKYDFEFEEVGFIYDNEKKVGASPDGLNDDFVLEMKSPTSWETYMDRTEKEFDRKHQDFWQVQTQMLVAGKDRCLYVVALPPDEDYNIDDVFIKVILPDEEAQNFIIERAKLGEKIIEKYLNEKIKFDEVVEKCCRTFF